MNSKLSGVVLLSVLLSVTNVVTASPATTKPLLSPNVLVSPGSTNYLAPVVTLRENKARYRGSKFWDEFVQTLGTDTSYLGNYQEALAYFDMFLLGRSVNAPNGKTLTNCVPKDAAMVIGRLAKIRQAVFINEAHHVPQHRVLTRGVLEALYKQGFRYFTAETLTTLDYSLVERGYPVIGTTGYYTDEPLYGDLIRKALELGYTVVPYESQSFDETQYERESAQAQNLIDRILKGDPKAKFVVHAGYAHIYEQATPDWTPMALLFKKRIGIDPLTVEQTSMSEHSAPKFEAAEYREATTDFDFTKPTVFECSGKPWVQADPQGLYDLTVFSPRSVYVNGRPTWLSLDGERKPYMLPTDVCRKQLPCLVQARHEGELPNAVPVDQLEVKDKTKRAALMLPSGGFEIRVLDVEENLIQVFEIKN